MSAPSHVVACERIRPTEMKIISTIQWTCYLLVGSGTKNRSMRTRYTTSAPAPVRDRQPNQQHVRNASLASKQKTSFLTTGNLAGSVNNLRFGIIPIMRRETDC